jgi:hypothetical protein
MSKPCVSFQVEKVRIESRQSRIFAGEECVARRPPIAALLLPCPAEANWSRQRTFIPLAASSIAVGMPTLPAPTTTTS